MKPIEKLCVAIAVVLLIFYIYNNHVIEGLSVSDELSAAEGDIIKINNYLDNLEKNDNSPYILLKTPEYNPGLYDDLKNKTDEHEEKIKKYSDKIQNSFPSEK
jgi:hypothetical protein